ncbi:MAG: amidase [Solimonas sp.]
MLGTGAPVHAATPPYETLSVAELHALMERQELNAEQLTQYFLARIEALDRHGPRLNAVIEVNPDALAIARALDAQNGPRGPLHGIPVLVKDNIDSADRMLTTAGSLALIDSRPRRDAAVVARLRAAGAVLLGKTNLSEWANFRGQRSVSGWSARGGQTLNPWGAGRNPCGSSSGSGAAIAAGLAVLAVGTETDGSIVCPSSANGIVGIKPTLGLVSRSGIIPIAASQDTAGPMAHSVADAALLLQVLAGSDADDTATRSIPADLAARLAPAPAATLKGLRLGVVRNQAGFHGGVDALFEQSLQTLADAGAELVDVKLELPKTVDDDETTILEYEFKDGLNRYLATRDGGPKSLAALIAFNDAMAALELPIFGQELFVSSDKRGPLTDAAYRNALARAKRATGRDGIDALLKKQRLAALVSPTMGPAWLTDSVLGDHFVGGSTSQAPAVAGYPHVTVPAGLVGGLPVGLSFVGGAWSEPQLIGIAAAFERMAQHLPRPPSPLAGG